MKGKASVVWHQDHEILQRLELVATMMLQGAKPFQIAQSLSVSLRTAFRDMNRVQELWRKQAIDDITAKRDRSIAQFRLAQTYAWDQYRTHQKTNAAMALKWMQAAMEAERSIVELEGTKAPKAVDVTSKGEQIGRGLEDLTDDELARIATGKA